MNKWNTLATAESVTKATEALTANNITVLFAKNSQEAKEKALAVIPEGAEIYTVSSTTVAHVGLLEELNDSGKYDSVKKKVMAMDRATQSREIQKLQSAPEYVIGSVHAVTEEGQILDASQTGSQLASYTYGAAHVIWVVGTQKIVPTIEDAMKRLYEHVLPLESERANKAYNITTGSNVSKIFIMNKEIKPSRITVIFVNEILGF